MAPGSWPLLNLCTNRCWFWRMQWSPWITIPFKTARWNIAIMLAGITPVKIRIQSSTFPSCLRPDFRHKHVVFLALFAQELCKGSHLDLKCSLATHIEVAKRVTYFTWDNFCTSIGLVGTTSSKHKLQTSETSCLEWGATNHLRSPKYKKHVQPGFDSLGFLLSDTSLYRIFCLTEKTHEWQGQVPISIRMIQQSEKQGNRSSA